MVRLQHEDGKTSCSTARHNPKRVNLPDVTQLPVKRGGVSILGYIIDKTA